MVCIGHNEDLDRFQNYVKMTKDEYEEYLLYN